ncbi:hypothetical protein FRC0522_00691 [Corynebacterium diphtheriae]|nr:hypothetical protein FRC0522_00691 [Corynebacterium diphtheriae]
MGRCGRGRAHFWAPIVGNNDARQCTGDDVTVVIGFAMWGCFPGVDDRAV